MEEFHMKRNTGSALLPVLMLILGAAAFALRSTLYAAAVDVKGLLLRGHPLEIGLTALTAAAMLLAALTAWTQKKTGFDAKPLGNCLAALGNAAAGAGILATVLTAESLAAGYLANAWQILGYAAPACLLLAGIARLRGKKPFFLLYAAASVFFALHIANQYRIWSGNPQAPDYSFQLLACVCLILAAYHRSAFSAGLGKRRAMLCFSLLGGFFCTLCCVQSDFPWLYLTNGAFFLCDLTFRTKK
jgi:hypothetical protein